MRKRLKRSYCLFKRRRPAGYSWIIAVALLAAAGCAKDARIAVDISGYARLPPPLIKRLNAIENIKTVKAEANAIFESRGRKKRFDVVLVAELPDKLRVDFMDPLAGVVATVISVPGQDSTSAFEGVLKSPWGHEEMIRIFLGATPEAITLDKDFPVDSEGRFWIAEGGGALSWSEADGKATYLEVDDGRISAEVIYGDYQERGRIIFPNLLNVRIVKPGVLLILKFGEVDFNEPVAPEVFKMPI